MKGRGTTPELFLPSHDVQRMASVLYDDEYDILSVRYSVGPEIGRGVNGSAWLHVDPATGEVRAFTIEGFVNGFLAKNPRIREIWPAPSAGSLPFPLAEPLASELLELVPA
jgi:hypothetical protein